MARTVRPLFFLSLLAVIGSPGCDKQGGGGSSHASASQMLGSPASPRSSGGIADYQKVAGPVRDGHATASVPMASYANPGMQPASRTLARGGRPVQAANFYINSTYMGGTGAKDRMEKLIADGVMVEGKQVKLEAFSRSYGQAFPIPSTEALTVVAATDHAKIVQTGDRAFLQVGIQAIRGEAPRRPPLNVALVIDRSGSMGNEGKLDAAKAAAAKLVDQLRPGDSFSLTAFDDKVDVLVPAVKIRGESDKARLRVAIEPLATGGGTNIYDGLSAGYAAARRFATPDGVNRVILLSDGEVTSGVNDAAAFSALARSNADADIQTTAVGMGVQYNEDMMMEVAREGQGNYHFLKDAADTNTVFAKELNELTSVVAKAVKLRIALADGVSLVRVLGASVLDPNQTREVKSYEKRLDRKVAEELGITANRQKDDREPGIKLFIPSFYRGDNHVVMLEVAVPPGIGTRSVADVFLKYKDLTRTANRDMHASSRISYTPDRAAAIASLDRNVKKNLLGFQTGEALAEAGRLMESGRIAEAIRRIDERMVVLGTAARQWGDRDLDRDGLLLDRYKAVLSELGKDRQLASGELGQYLKRSLTYAGYQMTR